MGIICGVWDEEVYLPSRNAAADLVFSSFVRLWIRQERRAEGSSWCERRVRRVSGEAAATASDQPRVTSPDATCLRRRDERAPTLPFAAPPGRCRRIVSSSCCNRGAIGEASLHMQMTWKWHKHVDTRIGFRFSSWAKKKKKKKVKPRLGSGQCTLHGHSASWSSGWWGWWCLAWRTSISPENMAKARQVKAAVSGSNCGGRTMVWANHFSTSMTFFGFKKVFCLSKYLLNSIVHHRARQSYTQHHKNTTICKGLIPVRSHIFGLW